MTRGRLVAAIAATLVAIGLLVLAVRSGGVGEVRTTVASAGAWAPVVFLLLHGAVAVTPVPRTIFTVAAGVLFGSVVGLLLAVAGTMLAAAAAFWLVRLVGRRFVERHSHRAGVAWLRARLDRSGLLAVLSLRLIPMVPFPVLNYTAGLSGVAFAPYLLGTLLGILPGTIAIVVLGDAAVGGTPHPAMLVVSVVSGLAGLAGAVVAARRPPLVPSAERKAEPDAAG